MKEIIDVFRMTEIPKDIRIEIIKRIGIAINYEYASNVTEPLVEVLVEQLKDCRESAIEVREERIQENREQNEEISLVQDSLIAKLFGKKALEVVFFIFLVAAISIPCYFGSFIEF